MMRLLVFVIMVLCCAGMGGEVKADWNGMAPSVSPIGTSSTLSYVPQIKTVVDGNPAVIAGRRDAIPDLSAQRRSINPPYTGAILVADARGTSQPVPTIELSKYTFSSSKEAFNEYTLAAARLHAERNILRGGEDMSDDLGKINIFRHLLQDKPGWQERSGIYAREEARNPFYAEAYAFIRTHKEGVKENMPEYFKEKVRNFSVSYNMYVGSYVEQPNVSDSSGQMALFHSVVSGLANLVFRSDKDRFYKDISKGSAYSQIYVDTLNNIFYLESGSELMKIDAIIKKNGSITDEQFRSSLRNISSIFEKSSRRYFQNMIPISETKIHQFQNILRTYLDKLNRQYIIR